MVEHVCHILVAVDRTEEREAILRRLRALREPPVAVDSVDDREALREALTSDVCDVVLLDERFGGGDSLPLLREVAGGDEATLFLVLSERDDAERRLEVLEAGGAGILTHKDVDTPLLERLVRTTAKRIARRAALQAETERFRLLIENQGEGAGIVDEEEYFLFANPAADEIFGVERGTLVGRNIREFVAPEVFDFTHSQTDLRRQGERATYEIEITRADGEPRRIQITATPWIDKRGEFAGSFALIQDVTLRRRAERVIHVQRDLSLALSGAETLDEALGFLVRAATRVSGMESAAFFFVDGETGALNLARQTGFPAEFEKTSSTFSRRTMVARAARRGVPVFDTPPGLLRSFEKPLKGGSLKTLALLPVHRGGRVIACLCIASRFRKEISGDGRISLEAMVAQTGIAIDRLRAAEEIRRSAAALRESEEKLRAVLNHSLQSFLLLAADGTVESFNRLADEHARNIFGRGLTEGDSVFDYTEQVEYRRAFRLGFRRALKGKISRTEIYVPRYGDKDKWLEVEYIPVVGEAGKVTRVLFAASDVTERRRSEERLRLLATAIRDAEEAVVITDAELDPPGPRILFVNDGFCRMSGYSEEEILGKTPRILQGPKTDREVLDRLKETLRAGRTFCGETTNYRKDGSEYRVEWHISPVTDDLGQITHYVSIQRDITERKRTEEALRRSEAGLAEAQHLAGLGSWEYEPATGKIAWSEETFRIYGFDPASGPPTFEDFINRVHPDDRRIVAASIEEAAASGEPYEYDRRLLLPDGSLKHIHAVGKPVKDETGKIIKLIGTVLDITERKEAEEELRRTAEELAARNRDLEVARAEAEEARIAVQQAADELRHAYDDAATARRFAEEANAAKSRFLANMSHEIRTPLTAILGFAKLIREKAQDDDTRDMVNHMIASGEHLLALINDILDISKVEAGQVSFEPEPLETRQFFDEIARMHQPLAEVKGLKLICRCDDTLPPWVMLDRARTRQIVINLLANAIKFTETGEVEFSVVPLEDTEGLEIRVRDTGPGIPEEKQAEVFEPFSQLHRPEGKVQEGTGLGLAITRRLVEAMHGTINLESASGKGSIFTVRLPGRFVQGARRDAAGEAGREEPVKPAEPLRVLVADDQEANRNLIRHVLENQGHRVRMAADGLEAVEAFREEAFDVVILDVQMPKLNGLEATRRIRALPGGDRVPILSLTAYAMPGDRENSLAAGATDYIAKPFDPDELALRVAALGRRRVGPKPKRGRDREMDDLRREYLRELQQRVKAYLDETPDLETLHVWGHKVAGSAGSFGYNDMTAVGRLIEQLDEAGRGPLLAGLLSRLLKSVRDALEALEAEEPAAGSTG